MAQITPILLTPIPSGSSFDLPMPDSTSTDASGNITWDFQEYLDDLPALLAARVSRNVEQYRTRLGTFVCVADAPGFLYRARWSEPSPFETRADQLTRPRESKGVLVLASNRFERRSMSVGVILYRCDVLYVRGTGAIVQ